MPSQFLANQHENKEPCVGQLSVLQLDFTLLTYILCHCGSLSCALFVLLPCTLFGSDVFRTLFGSFWPV